MTELTLANAAKNLIDLENKGGSSVNFEERMSDLRTAVDNLCKFCDKEPNGMIIHRAICNNCQRKILIPCGTDPEAHRRESCAAQTPKKR